MRDERRIALLHESIGAIIRAIDKYDWRDYTEVLEHMYNILNNLSPTEKDMHNVYSLYRNIVKAIINHDMNFNLAGFLYKKNILERISFLYKSGTDKCTTLCLCLSLLFFVREVWGLDEETIENNKIIDCEHTFNEIKSRIVERQYDYDWKSDSDILNEINILISSGYIDNRTLGVLLSYNEFQLLQNIAPLMGNSKQTLCDVKYDPMVSLDSSVKNTGAIDKVVSLEDIESYLYRCINTKDDGSSTFTLSKDVFRSDYISSMVDVNQLIDMGGKDLLLTIATIVWQLKEMHNVISIKEIVGQIDNILKESNELNNKLILIVPASMLLLHMREIKPEVWDNRKFRTMLDYCYNVVRRSNPGILHIPDLTYSIRVLANLLGGSNAIDYGKIQTRFGKELVNQCFGLTEPSLEFMGYSDVSTDMLSSLTEGFKVCRDGSIEVSIKDKNTSFVEEYSRNHRLLKLNEKNHDYDSMKYNLVYLVILIETLEKEVIYNRNIPPDSDVSLDAQKAIRLAKSDLSIYMDKLRMADKGFNLNEFYRQVKADKNTIKIDTVSTINGIKAIIKTILL